MISFAFLSKAFPFIILATSSLAHAYHWPSPKLDAMEGLLHEQTPEPDPSSNSLTDFLNDCELIDGESEAADWVRFAYHDMATHNIDDGTGGMDASIYYELDRDENVGGGMANAALDFRDMPGKYMSKSDIIAFGVVLAVAQCGGPTIPYRMGRVDALAAGPTGVPRPEQDLKTHTESFRRQGFTPTEMIGLVACGHTLGGVRFPDFPGIIPPTPDGSQNIVLFDTTPSMDNAIVVQYLNRSTQDPLVVHPNKTITSDFRIFSSDKNVTMKRLASPTVYRDTCQHLLERMINTVPRGVQLSDVIQFLPVKVDAVQLSVTHNALRLKAMLRLATANPKRNVTMFWENRIGGPCKPSRCSALVFSTHDTTMELTRRLGLSPQKYYFDTPVNATTSISKFWFEVEENDGRTPKLILDNGGTGYQITQDRVLFDTVRTQYIFVIPVDPATATPPFTRLIVAIRNDTLPTRVYANVMWRVTENPIDETFEFQPAPEIQSTAGYCFYKTEIPGTDTFMFDLFSVVNGTQYSEDGRNIAFLQRTADSR